MTGTGSTATLEILKASWSAGHVFLALVNADAVFPDHGAVPLNEVCGRLRVRKTAVQMEDGAASASRELPGAIASCSAPCQPSVSMVVGR